MLTLSKDQTIALAVIDKWYADIKQNPDKYFSLTQSTTTDLGDSFLFGMTPPTEVTVAPNPSRKPYITLGGYAGTGKTTLISILREELNRINPKAKVAFCSYTGKAVQVMKRKLMEQKVSIKGDFLGTIHSLIYRTIEDSSGRVLGWALKDKFELNYDLMIVDEASMVDEKIWADLMSFRIPIIAVGDHGQLPPVSGEFNLMQKPHLRLTEIHRQARENPIIELSILARQNGEIPHGSYGGAVEKVSYAESGSMVEDIFSNYNPDTLILCGYNNSRVKINTAVRGYLGFENPEPCADDRVICLRNNREKAIFNGMLGTILDIKRLEGEKYQTTILMEGMPNAYEGIISSEQFFSPKTLNNILGYKKTQGMDLFDFGYALTVHKAQGSQARKVVLFEERFKEMDDEMWKRWLYTAVTRAEEELLIFG